MGIPSKVKRLVRRQRKLLRSLEKLETTEEWKMLASYLKTNIDYHTEVLHSILRSGVLLKRQKEELMEVEWKLKKYLAVKDFIEEIKGTAISLEELVEEVKDYE
ncbi:MAG: hypothetical protein DRG27_00620 [Deltaproteobacteria bacterium]|nr:MAG: hypothetical protein DRG27_00620 [Deltaproteobacteria bacterium]